jgi:hypothetical protein
LFLIGPQFTTKVNLQQPASRPDFVDCYSPTVYMNVKQGGRKEGTQEKDE